VFQSIPDAAARERLIAAYDADLSEAEYALGYRWDVVVRGRLETPSERER
jgi:protocatechuate 3,4-dioxygenase beta subunit